MASIWRPFTQMKTAPKVWPVIERAQGAELFLKNGERVLDAISSWWVITHGHCEPSLVEALQKQSQELDQILFANFSHTPAENLVKELSKLLPKKLSRVFFSDDGSTSVEVALKQALQSRQQQGMPEKNTFLTFTNSYHGDTAGCMSVSGPGVFTQAYKPMLFRSLVAKQARFSHEEPRKFYEDFERLLNKHHKEICAVIVEPFIQGAGGMIIWPKKALDHITRLTREAGIYLIFDEVMTGFGRTGKLFGFQHLDIVPDILCLSKGLTGGFLPLGLTISSEEIYSSFLSAKKEKTFFHGHSFTGNPLSCSVACANLKKLREEQVEILKKWQMIEDVHKTRTAAIKNKVKDARYMGLVAAIEKQDSKGWLSSQAEEATEKARKKGVFLRPLGDVFYTLPPYCTTREQLHKIWDVLEELAV